MCNADYEKNRLKTTFKIDLEPRNREFNDQTRMRLFLATYRIF